MARHIHIHMDDVHDAGTSEGARKAWQKRSHGGVANLNTAVEKSHEDLTSNNWTTKPAKNPAYEKHLYIHKQFPGHQIYLYPEDNKFHHFPSVRHNKLFEEKIGPYPRRGVNRKEGNLKNLKEHLNKFHEAFGLKAEK